MLGSSLYRRAGDDYDNFLDGNGRDVWRSCDN